MLKGLGKCAFRITCIDNLVNVFKAVAEKMPSRFIIIYDQNARHDFNLIRNHGIQA